MWAKLPTQVIFVYNGKEKVERIIFLTFDEEELENDKLFEMFKFLQKKFDIFLNDSYETLQEHIFLTLTLGELRGYIRKHILKTNDDICVFSLWSNIDFSCANNSLVFSPFVNNGPVLQNPDSQLLYVTYPGVFNLPVFCVVKSGDLDTKRLCTTGIDKPYINKIVTALKGLDRSEEPIKLESKNNSNSEYNFKWTDNNIDLIYSLEDFKKRISVFTKDNIFLSGTKVMYKDPDPEELNKQTDLTKITLYDKNYNDEIIDITRLTIVASDDKIRLYNNPTFIKILSEKKHIKRSIKVDFDAEFTSVFVPDYELDFFLSTTSKTRNIFVDRTRSYNIMSAAGHIYFTGYIIDISFTLYMTAMILNLQILEKKVDKFKKTNKLGNRYFSRYCQGNRKPRLERDIIPVAGDFEKHNNFYKHIRNEGDMFYSSEIDAFQICDSPGLTNIGFISEIFYGYNTCLPCCYKNYKERSSVFRTCVGYSKINDDDNYINPYICIFRNYRIITDKNKLGLLLGPIDELFNNNLISFDQTRNKIKEIPNISKRKEGKIYKTRNDKEEDDSYQISSDIKTLQYNGRVVNSLSLHQNFFVSNDFVEIYSSVLVDDDKPIQKYSNKHDFVLKKHTKHISLNGIETKLNKFGEKYNEISKLKNYIVLSRQNRIEISKGYTIYRINENEIDFNEERNITYSTENNIFFINEKICFSPLLVDNYRKNPEKTLEELNFYIVINNKIHIIQTIDKLDINDEITVSPISLEKKKIIVEKFFNINPLSFSYNTKEYSINEFEYVRNKQFNSYLDQSGTKYSYVMPVTNLKKNSLGYYITDVLFKKYFHVIPKNNRTEHKKVFLANLLNIVPIDVIDFDETFSVSKHKSLIEELKKNINKLYL